MLTPSASSVDHFTWSAISTPQITNSPFVATITAVDASGSTVASFNGHVAISASSSAGPVAVNPIVTGNFINGVWNGTFTVLQMAAGVMISADDGAGHTGTSNPFDVGNAQATAALTVLASPLNGGMVSGGGMCPVGSQQQISAKANSGWHFSQWQDANTDNPRYVTVPPEGATYTAVFVQPIVITSDTLLPAGALGMDYFQTLTVAGGAAPYTWSISSGTFPPGLTLSSSGIISGKPTTGNTYSFLVRCAGADGLSAEKNFSLTIGSNAMSAVVAANAQGAPGDLAVVMINLLSPQGAENTVGFSLAWDSSLLSFDSVVGGAVLGAAWVIFNTNQVAFGRLGVLLAESGSQSFGAGTNQIARLSLRLASNIAASVKARVSFTDQPVTREISSIDANVLPSVFQDGTVNIQVGLEGDLAPRPNGDMKLSAADYTMVGRIVAGLVAQSDLSESEFMRVDCAPRASLGDGKISASDWTQTGRYVLGLDAPQAAGGPARPVTSLKASSDIVEVHDYKTGSGARAVWIASTNGTAGSTVSVPVMLDARGNENTIAFSLQFAPALLTDISCAVGNLPAGASLILNTNRSEEGKLGILLALPTGQNVTSGTYQLCVFNARIAPNIGSASSASLWFGDVPIIRELVSADVDVLTTQFAAGAVTFASDAAVLGNTEMYAGFTISGVIGKSYQIEYSEPLTPGSWTTLATAQLTQSPQLWVDTTATTNRFRLYRAALLPEAP